MSVEDAASIQHRRQTWLLSRLHPEAGRKSPPPPPALPSPLTPPFWPPWAGLGLSPTRRGGRGARRWAGMHTGMEGGFQEEEQEWQVVETWEIRTSTDVERNSSRLSGRQGKLGF